MLSLAICWEQQTDLADYLIDLHFHSSYSFIHPSVQLLFLSRNVGSDPYPSILHTLTHISDFSGEQRKTNLQLLHQLELGTSHMEMVVTGTSHAWGKMTDFGERKEIRIGCIRRENLQF